MTIYLSGGMTGLPDLNRPAFYAMAKKLRKRGHTVINPPELDLAEKCMTWEACLQRDLRALTRCDAVATLPGWKKSRGANLEVYVARALSYPVHPATYYLKRRGGKKK